MRALELEFVRRRSLRLSWLGAVVLAVGAGSALFVTDQYFSVQTRIGEVDARVNAIQQINSLLADRGNSEAQPLSVAAAKDIAATRLPWAALFNALESAGSDNIGLLAVEPDAEAAQQKLHILGEARQIEDVTAYARRLAGAKPIWQAIVTDHEIHPETKNVRFRLDIVWGQ